jgi:voltage-gated potassium channel
VARRLGVIDAFVLLLALASAALVFVVLATDPEGAVLQRIRWIEFGLIVLFALEFLLAFARHRHRIAYAMRNWYELIALVPVTGGPAVDWPGGLAVVVIVLLARFGRVVDRLFGDEAFHRVVERVRRWAVESVADAVTLRVLDQTLGVLQKGEYTRNLATALETHGDEMLALVTEKVKADPEVGAVRHIPFFDVVVVTSAKVSQRIVIDLLRDPRMDQMVKDIIADNVKQIRAEVAKQDAALTARLFS